MLQTLFLLGSIYLVSSGRINIPSMYYWNIYPASQVPSSHNLDLTFYSKSIYVFGLWIVSSSKCSDAGLRKAADTIYFMIGSTRRDILTKFESERIHLAVIARDPIEELLDIPEYRYLQNMYPNDPGYWNRRARGLGATTYTRTVSCAEENLLRLTPDRYVGQDICIHEAAHTIFEFGEALINPSYSPYYLTRAFGISRSAGRFAGNYANTNEKEYWAEGTQYYFNANSAPNPPLSGWRNDLPQKTALRSYDWNLYWLINKVYRPSSPAAISSNPIGSAPSPSASKEDGKSSLLLVWIAVGVLGFCCLVIGGYLCMRRRAKNYRGTTESELQLMSKNESEYEPPNVNVTISDPQ